MLAPLKNTGAAATAAALDDDYLTAIRSQLGEIIHTFANMQLKTKDCAITI